MSESTGTKTARNCYTCQYWMGCSTRVVGPRTVKYDRSETAVCNRNGQTKYAWQSCGQHEKSWNLG